MARVGALLGLTMVLVSAAACGGGDGAADGAAAVDAGYELTFVRHGGEHDLYSVAGLSVPIPRHRDVNERLAQSILRRTARHLETK